MVPIRRRMLFPSFFHLKSSVWYHIRRVVSRGEFGGISFPKFRRKKRGENALQVNLAQKRFHGFQRGSGHALLPK